MLLLLKAAATEHWQPESSCSASGAGSAAGCCSCRAGMRPTGHQWGRAGTGKGLGTWQGAGRLGGPGGGQGGRRHAHWQAPSQGAEPEVPSPACHSARHGGAPAAPPSQSPP
eukprot:101566-Rhodomonas_salina.4